MKTTDPVILDELKFDRDNTANEVLAEQGRAYAQTEYESGEMDDWIEDECNTHDTFLIAHALIRWLDSGESKEQLIAWLPPCSIKDFRAQIEHIIDLKAIMIAEDL